MPLPLSPPVPQTLNRNPNPPITQVIAYGEEVGDSLAIAAESWHASGGGDRVMKVAFFFGFEEVFSMKGVLLAKSPAPASPQASGPPLPASLPVALAPVGRHFGIAPTFKSSDIMPAPPKRNRGMSTDRKRTCPTLPSRKSRPVPQIARARPRP